MDTRKPQSRVPRPRRVPVKIPVALSTVDMFFDSEIMNLSKGGVFIKADIALPLGSEVEFEFILPASGGAVAATGTVVWARSAGRKIAGYLSAHPPGMGVQFTSISPRDMELLLDALDELIEKS